MPVIHMLDFFGTFAFALSGALTAIKKDMDLFGIFVLALVTAIGGGTIRDILMGIAPVFFLNQPVYIYLSVAAAFCAFFFHRGLFKINSVILIADAIGLGTFVCLGVSKALAAQVSFTGAVLLGLITAVMGGIIRDLLENEIPAVLIRDFYAMTCILGGITYVLLYKLGISQDIIVLLTAGLVITLRFLAIKFHWNFIKVP
ncbi:MAG TPA: trimeric intracellular cation channel family protein, partial [Bacillota bacterium]|nr:trimeric intracellular cation channel family protein [Bacillota bacterium]